MKPKKPKSLYFAYFKHLAFTLILFVVLIVGLSLAFYSYFKYTDEEVLVPDLKGLTVLDAVNVLQEKGLKPYVITQTSEAQPMFSVISQQTLAQSQVRKGREIVFTVSVGPAWMEFPDLRGKNVHETQRLLAPKAGDQSPQKIFIKEIQWISSDRPFGEIVDQQPLRTRLTDQPVGIFLKVSREDTSFVPGFKGLYLEQALGMLSSKGTPYQVQFKETEDEKQDGRVLDQSPAEGEKAFFSQSMKLTVGKWKGREGDFKTVSFPIPEELSQNRIRLVLFDNRGKTVLFEGRAYRGETLFRALRVYGSARLVVYKMENDSEKFVQELAQ